jgi:hypothetical protein
LHISFQENIGTQVSEPAVTVKQLQNLEELPKKQTGFVEDNSSHSRMPDCKGNLFKVSAYIFL